MCVCLCVTLFDHALHLSTQLQRSLDKANDQISYLKERLEVTQKERTQALDERDEVVQKQYNENLRRKTLEKEVSDFMGYKTA